MACGKITDQQKADDHSVRIQKRANQSDGRTGPEDECRAFLGDSERGALHSYFISFLRACITCATYDPLRRQGGDQQSEGNSYRLSYGGATFEVT